MLFFDLDIYIKIIYRKSKYLISPNKNTYYIHIYFKLTDLDVVNYLNIEFNVN